MTIKKGRPRVPDITRRDKQTIVYLTPVQRQKLINVAKDQGTTISSVISDAVTEYLSCRDNFEPTPNSSLIPTQFAQLVASQVVQALLIHDFSHSTHTDHTQPNKNADRDETVDPELIDFIQDFDL